MAGGHPLWRAGAAELLGTGMLTLAVVGSGIAVTDLTADAGLRLGIDAAATGLVLYAVIQLLGPISGAHLNPLVSLVEVALGARPWRHLGIYLPAQFIGGALGVILANTIFGHSPVAISSTDRLSAAHLCAEVVATAGLVMLVFVLVRSGKHRSVAAAVGAYIAAAYFFTSSTCFANPAVTIGRILTDTFAGIAPVSALAFLPMQILGAAIGAILVLVLTPAGRRDDRGPTTRQLTTD